MVDNTPNRGLHRPPSGYFARQAAGRLMRENMEMLDETSGAVVETATASGDGATTVFALGHSMDTVPSGAVLQPTSAAAAADHYRSGLTETAVEVTFATAPAAGTDNIGFELVLFE